MRRVLRTGIKLTLLAAFSALPLVAQNYLYGTGNPTWGINIPIENGFINVANGNVHMEIPIGSQQQRGSLSLTESLVYDSRIWQIVNTGTSYSFQAVPGGGWTFGGTAFEGSLSAQPSIVSESVPCSGSGGSQGYDEVIYTMTDQSGTAHIFDPGIHILYGTTCPNGNTGNIGNTTTGSAYAVDGSGYYLTIPSGTCVVGSECQALVFDPSGNLGGAEDRNGNYIGMAYTEPPNKFTWTDTLGRTAFVETEQNSTTTYLDVLTVGGALKRYTVNWETISVNTNFGQSGVTECNASPCNTLSVVQSLTLPDGSSYGFNYDFGTTSGHYGELTSMTLPTGGTVSFAYQNYLDSYRNENRWLYTYAGGNGSYTLSPQVYQNNYCSGPNEVGCQEQMTVKDGNSNQVVYLLTLDNGAWDSQTDYYNNVNGSLVHILQTTTTISTQNSCPQSICGNNGAEWITASCVTTTLIDTGQTSQTQYVYNNPKYGKPDEVKVWDYANPNPQCQGSNTPSKETDYAYGYFVNGAEYVTNIQQLYGGTLAAQTALGYDCNSPNPPQNCSLTATSGLPGHSSSIGYFGGLQIPITYRGNVTSVVTGTGTTVSTSSLYDDAGAILKSIDGNGNQTSYSAMCSDAYPSVMTRPASVCGGGSLQSTMLYECSSGLPTYTKDANGQTTGYSYVTSGSNLGRLQTVTRPDGGSTNYAYPSATETDQTVAQSSSVNVTHKSILDQFGRGYQSVTVAPEGNISSETTYDATGRPYAVTNLHLVGTTSPTDGTRYTYYDVLGRTTKIVAPDGSATTSQYSGNAQTVTDARSNSKQYTYDAFHRLTAVLEPNSSGVLTYETDYQYNGVDKPTEIDQWGGAKNSSSPGDRQRLFAYDGLGRLIAENIPENQSALSPASLTCVGTVSGTKWTKCYAYDANSNIQSKIDARAVSTTYSYDAQNRLCSKSYSNDPSGTPTSCFQYDTSSVSGAGGNLLGHLTNQWTQSTSKGSCNAGLLTSGGYQTLRAMLSFDAMGRPLSAQQCTPSNCATAVPYELDAGYDLAGNLTSYTNGLASTPGAGSGPLTFSQTFDSAGRLQNLMSTWSDSVHPSALISAPTYAPPGMVTSAAFGNGITLGRVYNSDLLPTSETDKTGSGTGGGSTVAAPGSATVTVTGAEQSK
jgi:YD repeat-containing protein